jgi:benzodiazapine receptor
MSTLIPDGNAGAPRRRSFMALAAFVSLCFLVAAAGGAVTAESVGTWYVGLAKPSFNPPAWVFGPVWTVLYLMIAVAGWRVWRRRGEAGARDALAAWGVQLALNLGWSVLFFGARMIGAALVEIVVLLAAILATVALSWRIDRLAGWLLVPYAAWVAFATVLNAALWWLNT